MDWLIPISEGHLRAILKVATKINAEIHRMVEDLEVRVRLKKDGAEPSPDTPAELARLVRNDIQKWMKVVKIAGIKVN